MNLPSEKKCYQLFEKYEMLPNIQAHSKMVYFVAQTICAHLTIKDFPCELTCKAALLHDITKTMSLKSHEHHDQTAEILLTKLGYPEIGAIVGEHVVLKKFDFAGNLTPQEVVFYSDKRIKHDQLVSIDQRIADLQIRYGQTSPQKSKQIEKNHQLALQLEQKINRYLDKNIQDLFSGKK